MRKSSLTALIEKTKKVVEREIKLEREVVLNRYQVLKTAVYDAFVTNASKKRPDYYHHAKARFWSLAEQSKEVVQDLLIDLALWEEKQDSYERIMNALLREKSA